jgi:HD-like signal output (HDOD) protein
MAFSFWRFLARMFGIRGSLPAPSHRPLVMRAPTPTSPPLDAVAAFQLDQGAEYLPTDRKSLLDEERLRLEALKIRVVDCFHDQKFEITAFPSRAAQILRMLEDPDFDIGHLVQIAQREPVISASVLRAANSAAYAGITRIENVRDAVMRLGAQTVAAIATAVTARGLFEEGAKATRSRFGDTWKRLWLHSVTTAFAAGDYVSSSRKGNLEQCFLGGMLHDIGKTFALRALSSLPLEADPKGPISPPLLEALLEAVHVELGKEVATSWNLPAFIVDACANHHRPSDTDDRGLNVIRVVSGLDDLCTNPQHREGLEDEIRRAAGTLGLDGYMLRALATERRACAIKAATV